MTMSKQGAAEELHQGIVAELRRGLSVVLVLARLAREQYGYTLLKELDSAGLPVDQNTLYPLLRRLESQGLLSSGGRWRRIRGTTGTPLGGDPEGADTARSGSCWRRSTMRHADDIADLFARYAAEVGRHLPVRGREDIEREIAATLADRLDDQVGPSGRAATMDDAVAMLKETGHPRKTAASYLADTHLVGPALYPLFLLVCRVALPVLAAVLIGALTLSAALAADPSIGFLEHLGRILGSTVGGVLQAFAILVIVFAVWNL
jgi:hypothetical protein